MALVPVRQDCQRTDALACRWIMRTNGLQSPCVGKLPARLDPEGVRGAYPGLRAFPAPLRMDFT